MFLKFLVLFLSIFLITCSFAQDREEIKEIPTEEERPGEFFYNRVIMDDIKSPVSENWYKIDSKLGTETKHIGYLNINSYKEKPEYKIKYKVELQMEISKVKIFQTYISTFDEKWNILYEKVITRKIDLSSKDRTEITTEFELKFDYKTMTYIIESPLGIGTGSLPKDIQITDGFVVGYLLKESDFVEGQHNFYTMSSNIENPFESVAVTVKSPITQKVIDKEGKIIEVQVYPCAYSYFLDKNLLCEFFYEPDGDLLAVDIKDKRNTNIETRIYKVKNKEEAQVAKLSKFSQGGRRDPFEIPLKRNIKINIGGTLTDTTTLSRQLDELYKQFEEFEKKGKDLKEEELIKFKSEVSTFQIKVKDTKDNQLISKVSALLQKIEKLMVDAGFTVNYAQELKKYYDDILKLKQFGNYTDAQSVCKNILENYLPSIPKIAIEQDSKIVELINKIKEMKGRIDNIIEFITKKAPLVSCILYEETEIRTPVNFGLQIFNNTISPNVYYSIKDSSTSMVILKKRKDDKSGAMEETYPVGAIVDKDVIIEAINRDNIIVNYQGEKITLYMGLKTEKTSKK